MYVEPDKARIRERIEYVYSLFPRLAERAGQAAGTMSGGEQRMLEIGRSLMHEPRLVLMDEPSAGLAPIITRQVMESIRRFNREIGLTVLMIEPERPPGPGSQPPRICARVGTELLSGPLPRSTGRPPRATGVLGNAVKVACQPHPGQRLPTPTDIKRKEWARVRWAMTTVPQSIDTLRRCKEQL